jgi:hypothetical protein
MTNEQINTMCDAVNLTWDGELTLWDGPVAQEFEYRSDLIENLEGRVYWAEQRNDR